jgi:hypothetical protein
VEAAGHYSNILLVASATELITNHELQFLSLVFGLQAEITMKADGKPGMSDEEVHSLTKLSLCYPSNIIC